MNPILHFLDWMIQRHGEAITNLFVYVGIPYIAWLLWAAGRSKENQTKQHIRSGGSSARQNPFAGEPMDI